MAHNFEQFNATLGTRLARYRSGSDTTTRQSTNGSSSFTNGRVHDAIASPSTGGLDPAPRRGFHQRSHSNSSNSSSSSSSNSSTSSSSANSDEDSSPDEDVDKFLDSVLSSETTNSTLNGSVVVSANIQFRRVRELGRGGCGTVHLAVLDDGRFAAVKELPLTDKRGIDKELHVMFNLPAHPHIVRYLGSRRSQHHINLVMEFVSGGTIQSLRQEIGRFSDKVVCRYARMALLGLQHLHEHRLIHQDIKGANVLLDEQGNAKIADFGCIRDMTGQALTMTAGTPLWMAPEVCRGGPSSFKSDVWSFGCLLLEMTNESGYPWTFPSGTSVFQVAHAIGYAEKPPAIPTTLSASLQDFMRCCLHLDPNRRSSVAELLQHRFLVDASAINDDECWTLSRHFSAFQASRANSHGPVGGPLRATSSKKLSHNGGGLQNNNDTVFLLEHASDDDDDGAQRMKLPATKAVARAPEHHTVNGKDLVWLSRGESSVERHKKKKHGSGTKIGPGDLRESTTPPPPPPPDSEETPQKKSLFDKFRCLASV